MPRFACSVVAARLTPAERLNRHSAFLVDAASLDEAVGKAMRITRRGYPPAAGWQDHHVVACPDSNVIDPDVHEVRVTPHE
jgi:hypothetical protein